MKDENLNKRINTKGANKEFPLTSLGVAEGVLLTIERAGGKIDTQALSTSLKVRGGAFARKLSSIKRYNLVTGQGMLSISEIGKKIMHPISDEELTKSRKEAFMTVPLFSEIYQRFKLNLPEDKSFIAILVREHNLKEIDAKTILNIYKTSIKDFLSAAGEDVAPVEEVVGTHSTLMKQPPKKDGKLSVYISSPMGENNFKADNKAELTILKNKLAKLFSLIEDELPDTKQEEQEDEE